MRASEVCWVCGKLKGQPPNCNGHYSGVGKCYGCGIRQAEADGYCIKCDRKKNSDALRGKERE